MHSFNDARKETILSPKNGSSSYLNKEDESLAEIQENKSAKSLVA